MTHDVSRIHGSARRVDSEPVEITVSGELDVARSELSGALDAALGGGACRIVVNLLDVSFIDSSVLRVLVLARREEIVAALRRAVPGVSVKTLTARLRALEDAGFVRRTAKPTVPPQVTYALTSTGHELRDTLTALRALAAWWGAEPAAGPADHPAPRRAP